MGFLAANVENELPGELIDRHSSMRFTYLFVLLITVVSLSAAGSTVMRSTATYTSGKDTVQAYLCVPDSSGPFPALILIHEWWGLNDWVRENAQSIAAQGYITLAIDLYRGQVATTMDEAHQLSRGLPEDRAARDLQAAFDFLKARSDVKPDRMGSLGWCMGGGFSLVAALTLPHLASCTVCYGRLITDSSSIQKISCPLLGIFGVEDKGIPPASVKEFETICRHFGKSIEVKIYDGAGHAFMNPNNKDGYRASSAKDAWARIDSFFERTLKN